MKTSFNIVSDIDLQIKYNHHKKKWLAYSLTWEEIYFKSDSLDQLFEDLKKNLKDFKINLVESEGENESC